MRRLPARLIGVLMLCAAGTVIAQPEPLAPPFVWFGETELDDVLGEADMEFTLKQLDRADLYEVELESGYSFTLEEAEGGYTFALDEGDRYNPASGNWRRKVRLLRVVCPGTESMVLAMLGPIQGLEPIVNNLIGSNDGGLTAYYEFTAPFTADQLVDPLMAALERAQIQSKAAYSVAGSNVHQIQGQLMQPSDFTILFRMEVGIIGPNSMLGFWYGEPEDSDPTSPCFAEGWIYWDRMSP